MSLSIDALIKKFANTYNILPQQLGQYETIGAYWLEISEWLVAKAVNEELSKLEQNPLWGVIWNMLDRSNRHASNSLVLSSLNQPESGEVLARAVLESAVNVLYILHGDIFERLNGYMADYISTERRQNHLWSQAIAKLTDTNEIAQHNAALQQKEHYLRIQETALSEFASEISKIYDPTKKLPSISERFAAVNHELGYRTFYAAMCSQAHGDAEDLLNKLFIVSRDEPKLIRMLQNETENFSRMLIFSAIIFQLEAVGTFGYAHGLHSVADEMIRGMIEIHKIAQHFAEESSKIATINSL